MKYLMTLCFLNLFIKGTNAQDSVRIQKLKSPYTTTFKKDAPITGGAFALTVLGVYLIQNKKDITTAELLNKTKENVIFLTAEVQDITQKRLMTTAIYHFTVPLPCPLL